jgi:hypothetical protein
MTVAFYITKASGEQELFDIKKFRRSLRRAGASTHLISQLINTIEKMPELRSTQEIYEFALHQLSEEDVPAASRYNIKRAIFELGPAGMPFEQFIGALFKEQEYTIKTNQIVAGHCVSHEVDVIAIKDNRHCMVECKFHNQQGPKTDVRVALYVKARFDDIERAWNDKEPGKHKFHEVWIATNTKFTTEAIKYAECMGMHLLGWSYPEKKNLQNLIDTLRLHPITALVSLNRQQKRILINNGIILCRDAQNNEKLIQNLLHFTPHAAKKFITECERICAMGCIEDGTLTATISDK